MSKQTQVLKPISKSQGPTSITAQTPANPKTAHRKGPSTSSPPKSFPKNPTPTPPKITMVKDAGAQNPSSRTLSNPPKMSIEEARKRLEEEQRKLQKEREEFEREKKRFEEEKARLNRQKLQSQGMKQFFVRFFFYGPYDMKLLCESVCEACTNPQLFDLLFE
jgi:hypothetical protein